MIVENNGINSVQNTNNRKRKTYSASINQSNNFVSNIKSKPCDNKIIKHENQLLFRKRTIIKGSNTKI